MVFIWNIYYNFQKMLSPSRGIEPRSPPWEEGISTTIPTGILVMRRCCKALFIQFLMVFIWNTYYNFQKMLCPSWGIETRSLTWEVGIATTIPIGMLLDKWIRKSIQKFTIHFLQVHTKEWTFDMIHASYHFWMSCKVCWFFCIKGGKNELLSA